MNVNFGLLIPECTALAVLIILMTGEILSKDFSRKAAFAVTFFGGLITALTLLPLIGKEGTTFAGFFQTNGLAVFFKLFFIVTSLCVLQMSREFFETRLAKPGEFYLILWSALLGLFFLVSSANLLVLFISLEIVSLSFYIMAAYLKKDLMSIEAGLKYLVLGSLASALFIYGISLVYAVTGTTFMEDVRTWHSLNPANQILLLGIIFMLSGAAFKVASVPFQFWVPDVYEGAPTPVVAFLSVGSKGAGIAILILLLFKVFPAFDEQRVMLFSSLAALTILYGNLGALVQTNIKRLFGYSSIGHAGYLLIGIAVGGIEGVSAVLYYLMAYGITNLAAFLTITLTSRHLGSDQIEHYQGLARKSPFLAAALFLSLLSLAGIPPLAGFFGKFLVLYAAVQADLLWLAFIGLLAVAVSLFYYLSIVRRMYIDEPRDENPISISLLSKTMLGLLMLGILFVGIWQAPFLECARYAGKVLF